MATLSQVNKNFTLLTLYVIIANEKEEMGFYDTFLENDWTSEGRREKRRESERERKREDFKEGGRSPTLLKGVSEREMAVKAGWELKALRRPVLLIQIVKYTQQRQCAVCADSFLIGHHTPRGHLKNKKRLHPMTLLATTHDLQTSRWEYKTEHSGKEVR